MSTPGLVPWPDVVVIFPRSLVIFQNESTSTTEAFIVLFKHITLLLSAHAVNLCKWERKRLLAPFVNIIKLLIKGPAP